VSRPGDGARARGGADPIPVASARRRLMALARLLSRSDRWLLLAIGALAVLITFCSATQSLAIKWMIDGATDGRWALATGAALVGGLAAGMLGASGRVYMNLQIWAARIVGLEVSRTTVTHAASMPGLDQVSIVTASGVDFVRSAFAVPDLVMLAARIAVGVVLLATVDPLLILVVVFAAPSVLLATRAQRHVDRATAEAAELRRGADHLHGLFAEPTAAMEMRVFGAVDKLNARADHMWRRGSSVKFWGAMRAAGVSATGWLLLGVAYVGALAVTAFRASAGEATPGDVLLVSQLALQLRWDVLKTTSSVRDALAALRLTDRMLWLHDQANEQAMVLAGRGVDPPSRLADGIGFDDVSFAYPGTTRTVLKGLTFRIPAGTTVAIVGENGSGRRP
jgi:ATP-binding cassette subfamily B protein